MPTGFAIFMPVATVWEVETFAGGILRAGFFLGINPTNPEIKQCN
jgi:hypothetical protein